MPYRYVMKWRRYGGERLTVEAWPKSRELATPKEMRKPSFTIGRVSGPRTSLLWNLATEACRRYSSKRMNGVVTVHFPRDDLQAIADAYRLGLAAAVVSNASSEETARRALQYVCDCTREEVWFWASKLLHILGDGIDTKRVVKALCVISGAEAT